MSLDVAYSYCINLTQEEIDKQVTKNRQTVYIFIRNFASNAKNKTKKIIVITILGSTIYFSDVESSSAIGSSMPLPPVVKVQRSYKYLSEVKIASIPNKRCDKIYFVPDKRIIPLIYLNSHSVYINEKILKR